ncbi:MAG: ester cyclase [Balneolales bacterium]|nr:ester cyclase [Balneolales bacterium]
MTIQEKVKKLNEMILSGKALDAFEEFYHEDIEMSENGQDVRKGKDANRDFEVDFFSKITQFNGAEVINVAFGDNVSMVEMHFDYVHSEWGHKKFTQVGVQEWKDGLIIKETFYHG